MISDLGLRGMACSSKVERLEPGLPLQSFGSPGLDMGGGFQCCFSDCNLQGLTKFVCCLPLCFMGCVAVP